MLHLQFSDGRSKSFPFPTLWVESPFGRVAYFDSGPRDGDTLLLIHGLAADYTHWQDVAVALSANYRVIGLDLPGCGLSSTNWPVSLEIYAKTVLWLLAELGIERVVLCGHSLGGAVAMRAIRRASQVDIAALVLFDSAGFHHLRPLSALAPALFGHKRLTVLLTAFGPAFLRFCFHRRTARVRAFTKDALNRPPDARPIAKIFVELKTDLLTPHPIDDLKRMQLPTLVIWGKNDRLLPLAGSLERLRQLPDYRLEVIGQCGHMPLIEQADTSVHLMREFLNERLAPMTRTGAAGKIV